jgi:hypothetical protein
VRHDRRTGHPEPDHAHVLRRLRARELLEHDRLVDERRASPAVLLGPRQAREAGVVHLPGPLARIVRGEVLGEPRPDLLAERSLVRRVAQVHRGQP